MLEQPALAPAQLLPHPCRVYRGGGFGGASCHAGDDTRPAASLLHAVSPLHTPRWVVTAGRIFRRRIVRRKKKIAQPNLT